MSDSLRGDISPHDAESLDLHLQACEQCRDAYESDQATLQRVDRALHRPSDDFVTETMNAVRTAAATEGRDTSLPAGRATGRWRWTTGRATLAAAAFVAVVAIASWLLYPRAPAPGLPRETPRVAVDQAPSPPVEPAVVEDEPAPVLVADEESTEPAPTPHVAHRPSIRREASSAIASRAGGASEGSATDWRAPGSHGALKPGDVIETGADGGLLVEFGDGSSIDVAAETHLVLGDREGSADRPSTMKLLRGDIMVAVQPGGGRFEVWTPAAVAEVQGTEFVLSASEHATVLAVLDGTVLFRNDTGRVTARKMERAIAGIGHAPTEPSELVGREWARDWRQYAAGEMWRIPGADDPAAEAPPEGAEPGDTRERPRTSTSTDVLVVQATEAPPDVDDAPDTDRTDPVAVARAYVEACRSGDVDIAVSLLIADDPFTLQLRDAAAAITGETESEYAAAFSRLFAESSFLPTRLQLEAEAPVVDLPGDGSARVTVNRTWGLDQQLVMQQAEDGTWSIRPIESIKATTNSDTTLVEAQVSQASTVGGNDSYRVMSESEKRLRTLARGFDEYAKEHDSTLPPTATWVDAIEPYVLDRQAFSCPAAPDEEYGYAMNAQAGELQLPPGYTDRRKLFILSEWRGGGRNASATTEELRAMEPLHTDGTIIIAHAGVGTRRVSTETLFGGVATDDDVRETCGKHLAALERAAREFALANGGVLPGPDTWQDDIALYLLDEADAGDVFTCPAAEGIDYAYAINSDVAGTNARDLKGHDRIVLFFESDLNVPNASGDPDRDAARPARHLSPYFTDRVNRVEHLNGNAGYRAPPPLPEEE